MSSSKQPHLLASSLGSSKNQKTWLHLQYAHTYTESVLSVHTHMPTFTVFMYSLKSLTLSASSVIVSNRGSLQNRGRTCTYNIKVEVPSLKTMQWYTVFLRSDTAATIAFAVHYCAATVRGWHSQPLILRLPIEGYIYLKKNGICIGNLMSHLRNSSWAMISNY